MDFLKIETVQEVKNPFKCAICDNRFSEKLELNEHISLVHEGTTSSKCKICNASFGEKPKNKFHILQLFKLVLYTTA